jgi:saccharopine dehydrogenase-like NADP-dependent oxidoreductase
MASKRILLLLGSDRFAYPLMRYLAGESKKSGWKIRVGCMFDSHIGERIKAEPFSSDFTFHNITKIQECDQAIRKSDLVIGLMAESLLLQVADSCISQKKTLISPGRLTRQMALKKPLAKENDVLLLMDCGFSPGLDHITAKKAIDNIQSRGGKITSFKTYSGSYVSENSAVNPWGFKFAEPVGELLSWGRQNNRHLLNGKMQHIPYHRLFERGQSINIRDMFDMVAIPEGDSLYYRKIYNLEDATTIVKGKLGHKGLDRLFDLLIRLGLTDTYSRVDMGLEGSFHNFLDSLLPYSASGPLEQRVQDYIGATSEEIEKLKWLGLFDNTWIEGIREITPATVLQLVMENRFLPDAADKDTVVMEHQLEYEFREDQYEFSATLIMNGENQKESALAKIIGYTCGATAKSVMLKSFDMKGVHVPIMKEIYDPVLNELEELGIAFHITDKKIQSAEINSAV